MGLGCYRRGHGERVSIDTGHRHRCWRSDDVKPRVEELANA